MHLSEIEYDTERISYAPSCGSGRTSVVRILEAYMRLQKVSAASIYCAFRCSGAPSWDE